MCKSNNKVVIVEKKRNWNEVGNGKLNESNKKVCETSPLDHTEDGMWGFEDKLEALDYSVKEKDSCKIIQK